MKRPLFFTKKQIYFVKEVLRIFFEENDHLTIKSSASYLAEEILVNLMSKCNDLTAGDILNITDIFPPSQRSKSGERGEQ